MSVGRASTSASSPCPTARFAAPVAPSATFLVVLPASLAAVLAVPPASSAGATGGTAVVADPTAAGGSPAGASGTGAGVAAGSAADFTRLEQLRHALGRTTMAALNPLLPFSRNDYWELSELRERLRKTDTKGEQEHG